jgi:GNAT superfamily N-acetyltransferase
MVHGETFHPDILPGFIAETGIEKAGLITYAIAGEGCEIMTLDSLSPGRGIGGALIEAVKDAARRAGCRRLSVVTTNDNLHALRFYQRNGFTLAALRPNALAETRKRKPIPLLGEDGIPIRDEIELELMLE